jgi:hypothetical protein
MICNDTTVLLDEKKRNADVLRSWGGDRGNTELRSALMQIEMRKLINPGDTC